MYKFILSGGGTGGHIYPAIAIADELKRRYPDARFLFVGARDKMEMQKVPKAGYDIEGLWISGIQRNLKLSNLIFPFKLIISLMRSRKIIRKFKPDAVIGTGGFASAPLLRAASGMGVPCLIQEQNSYAGLANKWLARRARSICVAYDGMERYFPKDKITLTGNPVRQDIVEPGPKEDALEFFGLDNGKKTLLVLGGSLGARTINQLVEKHLPLFEKLGLQLLWQTGRHYYETYKKHDGENVKVKEFIYGMDTAYAAADMVISRAGALSVSELCIAGKPVVFIPSPNVAEDHQKKNAAAIASQGAAIMIEESRIDELFEREFTALAESPEKRQTLSDNIRKLARPQAVSAIADEVEDMLVENLYFVGIGGVGMSALARYFHAGGKTVSGYDRTASEMTHSLEENGIQLSYEDRVETIPKSFSDPKKTKVVYTPAVPEDNAILKSFRQSGHRVTKRSELLGRVTRQTRCLAVAGTHGKTTTSAILGHLLADAGQEVIAFLGGVSENYGSNLIQKGDKISVVEADEYDRSFLQLHPFMAGVTTMDADHLDIYGKPEQLREAFLEFAHRVPENGVLLHKKSLSLGGKTVAVDEEADFSARDIRIESGGYVFDLKTPDKTIKDLRFELPGRHNLFNAVMALSMAYCHGLPEEALRSGLAGFKGVRRRFSYRIKTENQILIDDYAHHPAEIDALREAVEEMHPGRDILAVFQPHLYSRTRDFADGFAESLSKFKKVLLMNIYPAREEPIEGVTPGWLLEKVMAPEKALVSKDELAGEVVRQNTGLVVMMGAGDIGEEVSRVEQAILKASSSKAKVQNNR